MPNRFLDYIDPTGEFTNKELQASTWYVTHRVLLRNILIGLLGGCSVLTLGYSLLSVGHYAAIGYWNDQAQRDRALVGIQSFPLSQSQYAAVPLEFDRPSLFRSAEGKYDFVMRVKNPNPNRMATLRYHYTYTGGRTRSQEVLILPQRGQMAAILGHMTNAYPSAVRFVPESVQWKQINPHRIVDPHRFIEDHLAFRISDLRFERASDVIPAGRVFFTLENATVYGLKQAEFYVVLFDRDEEVGVLPLTIESFRGGDIEAIELRTLLDLSRVSNIEVLPLVNIFNQSVFMPVGT